MSFLKHPNEDPFQKESRKVKGQQIDLDKLQNCKIVREYLETDLGGLKCNEDEDDCKVFGRWCSDEESTECPLLGAGIFTNDPRVCQQLKFWKDKPCDSFDSRLRCQSEFGGQCVEKQYWGVEGAKYPEYGTGQPGNDASCKDGSDLQRPIVKSEELNLQPTEKQVWKVKPEMEENYKMAPKDYFSEFHNTKEDHTRYKKHDPTGLWMIPESDPFKVPSLSEEDYRKGPAAGRFIDWTERARDEKWANFYSSDNYVKDKTIDRMVAQTTEKTCNDFGFVCQVYHGTKTLDIFDECPPKL